MKTAKDLRSLISAVLLLVSATVLWKTHRQVPFMMDDLWYSTLLSEETPIASFADILKSQVWHYNNWGGRSVTHTILQLTLLLGETAADFLNVVMTFLLAFLACLLAQNRSVPGLLISLGMLIGLNANWKMSMFWQAGAANYLYITVLLLFFLFCYLRELKEQEKEGQESRKALWGISFWMLPLGLLCGWSNENMGPSLWVISCLVIFLVYRREKKLKFWMVEGNLSCLVGSAFMILAPGNFVRSSQVPENQYGIWWRCFLRGYAQAKGALEFLFPTILITLFFVIVVKGILKERIGTANCLLLLCAFLSWGAMILSPHYPDRASFGTMCCLICVILSLAGKLCRERGELKWPLFLSGLFLWLRGMYFCGEFLAICWGWIR